MALPLTWQLANDTPLRRWFVLRLPHLDRVPAPPPQNLRAVVPRRRPDALPPWLIGMAFDWRLRLGLELPDDPAATTAHAGWCQIRDVVRGHGGGQISVASEGSGKLADAPVPQLFRLAVAAGAGGGLQRDELELSRIAVALARYEACYRGGVRRGDPLIALGVNPSTDALLGLCPEGAADELARLTVAARRGLAPLFPAKRIETNPDFTARGVPADGDLVIDGMLLDLKTVSRATLQLEWIWQLLGYVFLDREGRGIDRVGLYLSRHAWLQAWPVDDLLSALAGKSVTEGEIREEFEAVIGAPA